MNPQYLNSIYSHRYGKDDKRWQSVWATLCSFYFQKYIKSKDRVLDLGAGNCYFINHIKCLEKYAVDLNPETKKRAHPNVEVFQHPSTKLSSKLSGKIDVVFTSNFFEHLSSPQELLDTLSEIKKVLKQTGKLLILQPNIKLVKESFWDFVDHTLPLTEKSLGEALIISGFKIDYCKTRFLPYTIHSRLTTGAFFVKLYLKIPIFQLLLGKQTFIIASLLPKSQESASRK